MEEKTTRAAVLAACLLVLLLSGQLAPVSGSIISKYRDKYCKCFRKCYANCRNNDHQPRPVCNLRCDGKCMFPYGVSGASAALTGSRDGACREICLAYSGCSLDAAVTATGSDRGKN
jgi:hypothetical protein